jgi:16S rRNA processing protein RimM
MTDFPDRFMPGSKVWAAGREYTVSGARAHQDTLLITLEGVDTRTQAEGLRHQLLEVREDELSDLEEDAYYRFEIIGLKVVDLEGAELGKVAEVLETGSNDVYIVRDAESEVLIPAIDSVVKDVDLDAGVMTVELIGGLERRPLKSKKKRV